MTVYQVTLQGFDASTDATDHLIKWVASDIGVYRNDLQKFFNCLVETIDKTDLSLDDAGIDVIVTKSHWFKRT
jgi:hypothetical protein